ncbi:MAG TPA: dihydrolipoamide acetyltransferase family protein [Pseudonocardiaceae bacterium]|nr:dihydrolipoamide acetyltransferase family protein [Pseudonocardiaceae bacterium]
MPEFRLPDLGEGLTEAEIVNWLVEVGDTVGVDQVVVEVETAKAAVEVPVPFAGVITALHGAPGDSVPVGAPLVTVAEVGSGFAEPGVATSGNVLVGYGTSTSTRRVRNRRGRRAPAAPVVGVISPYVRKLARERGIELASVTGTGPGGIVRRADLDTAVPASPDRHTGAPSRDRRVPLRKAAAAKFTTSRREIPEATVWVDVDATELVAARAALNATRPDRPVSLLSLVSRFVVAGLRRYPELNARVEGDDVVLLGSVHLGVAAQTDKGLMVPVVRDAETLTTRDLAAAIRERTTATLTPADLTGGTFTVNNYGVFGVDGSAAIINHPEVAILGMGRIMDRPWAVDGQLVVRKVCQLTLAFDHRVCDGGTAGGFLRFVADCVESPVTALGDL